MKSLNMKVALSAVAIAMLATPALAAHSHAKVQQQRPIYDTVQTVATGTYPDGGADRTGTAQSVQSGAAFNLLNNSAND